MLPAIQAVVDRGIVDEKAIGIQGHSWGGYQIAYMVTQTNRFRAVEAGAPVADMISAYDGIRWGTGITRQFQYERTQSRIGGSIWQYPTRFIENSPIFWADRVQTPVLILQNDGDDAVPWYQGIEFFLALRRLGKEVYLFNYNGQPHGLRSRPDQKDYTIRMQQYFDHYLKGAPAPDWMTKGVTYLDRDRTALSTPEVTPIRAEMNCANPPPVDPPRLAALPRRVGDRIYTRKYYVWLPGYASWLWSSERPAAAPIHIFFVFVDHFEPGENYGLSERWLNEYPKVAQRHRDADGRPGSTATESSPSTATWSPSRSW